MTWEFFGFASTILPEKFNAAILAIEHRYFGDSLPFGEDSFTKENLQYLSIDQALADHLKVIEAFQKEHGLQDSPVISLGGSYSGVLSAYFRMRYPWKIDAALASSASLLMFEGAVNQYAFNEAVTRDYINYSPKCATSVREALNSLHSFFFVTDDELGLISEELNLCKPLANQREIGAVYAWIVRAFVQMAFLDYPYAIGDLPVYAVNEACEKVLTPQNSSYTGRFLDENSIVRTRLHQIQPLVEAANVMYNATNSNQCNDISQGGLLPGVSSIPFTYLACTEFIAYIGSNGVTDMFWDLPFSLNLIEGGCIDTLGFTTPMRPTWLVDTFGGTDYRKQFKNYSRIIFSNGSLDPTHAYSVTENVSDSVLAFVMDGAAHTLDMLSPNPADPESVIKGREFEILTIRKWLLELETASQ
eukprot:CAMPEP_0114981200 /NCGR_PEP_ID=MMETSP0216-20121206/5406_1 /TAXON_ID=223996 /ORGANISM="Protocruzia adherens, Strain Boccale" /LENGTH=416 /DNA_ID=CAMNT_0002342833 /DNA_START=218 /DNA_END=1468 /DNA_ORIENTATION=-